MAAVTISNLVDGQSVADSIIDISQFVEVIYTYRCKLCNVIFDGSDAATGHIFRTHLQEVVPGNSANSVSTLKQTIEQGTLANVETAPSTDGVSHVIPGAPVTGLQRMDPSRSTSMQFADGTDGSFFVKSSISDTSIPATSRLNMAAGSLVVVEPSSGSTHQEPADIQLSSNFHSNILQSNVQGRSCFREMRFSINGNEVWLSVPDDVTLDTGGPTKTSHWVETSVSTSAECTQADLGERSDGGKPLKLFETVVSCGSELEPRSSSMISSLPLIHTLDVTRLDPGESNTAKMSGESNHNEYFVCSKCNMGFVTLEDSTQHVNQFHMENFTSTQASDEVVMPPNTVSIGTQAQMYKKPGRKRKVIPTGEVINLDADGHSNQPVVSDMMVVSKEEPADSSAAINAVNMLGIGRVDNTAIGGQSKRKVRPPRALIEDYCISRRKHKKRQLPFEAFGLSCDVKGCSAKFLKPQSLSYHVTCHASIGDDDGQSAAFVCPECTMTFALWKALRMHLWKVHTIDSDLFKCQAATGPGLCRYRTDSLQKLELHQETHSDTRPFCCHSCGKGFKQSNQLKNHELTHLDGKGVGQSSVGDKNKECHICKRVFANQKSLKKHVEIVHDKRKPFLCNTCGHESSRKAMLDLHLRTHTGEKPYRCDMCNYMASDHNTLRRHRMRHTGEKPYKCLYCAYSCIQAISLKTHLKNKHPGCEGIYLCDSCQYQTVNKQHWLNHLEDHRNNLINEEAGQNSTNVIHVVVSSDPGDMGGKNQVVHVGDQTECAVTTAAQTLSVQTLGTTIKNVSTQQSYTVVDFGSQSYLEPVMMQVEGSTTEMMELKNVVTTLDGSVFHGGETVGGQQVVQLTRSPDGFYVIMNEQRHSLMAPVQTADGGTLYQSAISQLNSDVFLQQTTGTATTASALQMADGSLCHDPTTVVYTTASSDHMETGGLHHILTAISAQQGHKLDSSIEADHKHA